VRAVIETALAEYLNAGGNLATVALFLAIWRDLRAIDRRVLRLEIHAGKEPAAPAPAPT
jgi:hypothetical protein